MPKQEQKASITLKWLLCCVPKLLVAGSREWSIKPWSALQTIGPLWGWLLTASALSVYPGHTEFWQIWLFFSLKLTIFSLCLTPFIINTSINFCRSFVGLTFWTFNLFKAGTSCMDSQTLSLPYYQVLPPFGRFLIFFSLLWSSLSLIIIFFLLTIKCLIRSATALEQVNKI